MGNKTVKIKTLKHGSKNMGDEVVETEETKAEVEAKENEVIAKTEEDSYESPKLGDLFGTKPKTEAIETNETEDEEKQGEATDEKPEVEESSKEDIAAKAKAESKADDNDSIAKERDGFKSAMFEERRKRQELEARIAESKTEEQGVYIDEDTRSYVDIQVNKLKAEAQREKLEMSVEMCKGQFKDYDLITGYFVKAAEADPKLLDSVLATKNPAHTAYMRGKRLKLEEEFGSDPDQFVEAIKKKAIAEHEVETRKKIETEMLGKVAGKTKQPTSLSKMRAAGGDSDESWKPVSVSQLFGR